MCPRTRTLGSTLHPEGRLRESRSGAGVEAGPGCRAAALTPGLGGIPGVSAEKEALPGAQTILKLLSSPSVNVGT